MANSKTIAITQRDRFPKILILVSFQHSGCEHVPRLNAPRSSFRRNALHFVALFVQTGSGPFVHHSIVARMLQRDRPLLIPASAPPPLTPNMSG
jgi:hypothetical protein